MIIPADITAKHGVSQEDVFRHGPQAAGIEDAVFQFATTGNDHLLTARDMFKSEMMGGKVPASAMPVFLAGVRDHQQLIVKLKPLIRCRFRCRDF
jgi:NADH dehydrogenase [ubiquinone] 1 alpha subcomplex assembly factor 6